MPDKGRGRPSPSPVGALLAAVPALLGAGCAGLQPAGGAAPGLGPAALVDRLPAVAAGFRRGETRPAGPGQGREVAYATGGGRSTAAATVELLADDTGGVAALDAALADASRAGPAREMHETGRFAIAGADAAAPPLLCAQTAGRYGRERVSGLLCAGRVGETLLRIRVAMPTREPPPADPRAFAEAIAAGLSAPRAAAAAPPG